MNFTQNFVNFYRIAEFWQKNSRICHTEPLGEVSKNGKKCLNLWILRFAQNDDLGREFWQKNSRKFTKIP